MTELANVYGSVDEVEAGFRALSASEKEKASQLLVEAAEIIDSVALTADEGRKAIVSSRMVRRALGDGDSASMYPLGATQGSMSALGYTQSWTMQNGCSGELYLGKTDRQLLGLGNRIGSHSPLEDME